MIPSEEPTFKNQRARDNKSLFSVRPLEMTMYDLMINDLGPIPASRVGSDGEAAAPDADDSERDVDSDACYR